MGDGEVPEIQTGMPPPGMKNLDVPGVRATASGATATAGRATDLRAKDRSSKALSREVAAPTDATPSKCAPWDIQCGIRSLMLDSNPSSMLESGESVFCTWPRVGALDADGRLEYKEYGGAASDPFAVNTAALGMYAKLDFQSGGLQADALEEGELLEDGPEDAEDGEVLEPFHTDGSFRSYPPPQRSAGSDLHATGGCKPCAWMYKDESGCRNGESCKYCHLCPPGEVKRRKRDKLLQRLARSSCSKKQLASSAQTLQSKDTTGSGGFSFIPPRGPAHLKEMEPCYIEVPGLMAGQRSGPAPLAAAPKPTPLASVGSANHGDGSCKPCAWLFKGPAGSGCKSGQSCTYCHMCPPGELKRRKREKFKAQNAALMAQMVQECRLIRA